MSIELLFVAAGYLRTVVRMYEASFSGVLPACGRADSELDSSRVVLLRDTEGFVRLEGDNSGLRFSPNTT